MQLLFRELPTLEPLTHLHSTAHGIIIDMYLTPNITKQEWENVYIHCLTNVYKDPCIAANESEPFSEHTQVNMHRRDRVHHFLFSHSLLHHSPALLTAPMTSAFSPTYHQPMTKSSSALQPQLSPPLYLFPISLVPRPPLSLSPLGAAAPS